MQTTRARWWSKITRDLVLFGLGAVFMSHEVFLMTEERPWIIYAALGMLGSPVFLRVDEWRRRNGPP